jgi:hypothetical protein
VGRRETEMADYIIVTVPKTMTLVERISEVSKQVSARLESLEPPFNFKTDTLELTRYEQHNNKYRYHYIVDHEVKAPKEAEIFLTNREESDTGEGS